MVSSRNHISYILMIWRSFFPVQISYNINIANSFLGVHTGEDTFKCKECTNIGFKSYEHLRLHNLKVHKGVKFICDICGKEFSTPAVKSKHMSVVHHIKPKSSSKIENRLLIWLSPIHMWYLWKRISHASCKNKTYECGSSYQAKVI